jgi:hypothetical protein
VATSITKKKARQKKNRKSFARFLAIFQNAASLQATQAAKDAAKAIAEEAKEVIESQGFDWEPLSPRYLQRKIDEGYDPRMLIRTREYLEGIGWGVTHNRVWTGVPPNKIHQGSKLPLIILAKIHEFGTKTTPARPLWRTLLAKQVKDKPKFAAQYRREIEAASRRAKKALFK